MSIHSIRVARASAFVLLLCLVLAPACARTRPASFIRSTCPASIRAAGGTVECGLLHVPENRHAGTSRTIALPVAIFHSTSKHPAPDPVLFLPGGPGGSAMADPLRASHNPFLAERDYILLEPRGAAFAQPALQCPRINDLEGRIAAGHLRGAAAQTAFVDAATACRKRLVADGIDLDGYTSSETAQDIEDLRRLLGYRQWNLFGLSYGTRLALTVLREHPHSVRSLLLDSVLPAHVDFDESATANLRRALDAVFDGCAVDTACSRAYPHLHRDFAELVTQADRQPLPMPDVLGSDDKPVTVRGAEVVAALYGALHRPDMIARIPTIIEHGLHGDTSELAALVKSDQGRSSFAWGLRLSIWCSEEMPFEDPGRVEAQTAPAWGLGGVDERTTSPAVCRAWHVPPAPDRANAPVTSDTSVLALSGAFDPDTPPSWARSLIRHMPHARVIEFPDRSHAAGFTACGARIEPAFFHDPAAPLPTDCALQAPAPDFAPRRTGT